MTIEELSRFVEAANSGSFSSAAEKLHISAQGLGQSVRQLEKTLGIELLVKKPNGVVLTREGQQIYECCTEIINKAEEINRIAANAGKDTLRLKFAYRDSQIGRSMEEIIKGFNVDFNMSAEFLSCSNFSSLQDCYSGSDVNVIFTFGGIRDIPRSHDWTLFRLFEYNVYPVVNAESAPAKKSVLTADDIGKMIIAMTAEGDLSRRGVENYLKAHGITSPKISCSNTRRCLDLVRSNQNIVCFIPYMLHDVYVSSDSRLRLMNIADCPKLSYGAYVRRELDQNETLIALMDRLKASYTPLNHPL